MGKKKKKSKMFPVHAIKVYGGADVRLYSFLSSELVGSEWSNLRPASFNPGKEPVKQKAIWGLMPVWTIWRREKSQKIGLENAE